MYDYWYECMCEHTLYGRGARVSVCVKVKVSIGANVSACMSVGRGVSINMT